MLQNLIDIYAEIIDEAIVDVLNQKLDADTTIVVENEPDYI